MVHYFNTEIAKMCGVNEAIIIQNLFFWITKNKENNINYIDGKYWTYNSIKAFAELFPYFSERQINYALGNLKENGLIEIGNFNKNKFNKSTWYTLTDKANEILLKDFEPPIELEKKLELESANQKEEKESETENCQLEETSTSNRFDKTVYIDLTNLSNRSDKTVKSKTYNKQQIINQDINHIDLKHTHINKPSVCDNNAKLFDLFWNTYPKKVNRYQAKLEFDSLNPTQTLVDKMLKAIETQKQTTRWNIENGRYIPNPSNWLKFQRWNDEVESTTKVKPETTVAKTTTNKKPNQFSDFDQREYSEDDLSFLDNLWLNKAKAGVL